MATWPSILALFGSCFEIIGVFLMANAFLKVFWLQIPGMLVSALWRGKAAKEGEIIREYLGERGIISLQGLSFIGIGFVLQAISNLLQICAGPSPLN